jgi:hypothetical protein
VWHVLAAHSGRRLSTSPCAPQVLLGNFAVLQSLDPGYFGQGIYLNMDPEYAIEEYGRRVFGLTRVPLLICVVVVGNTLPVNAPPCCIPFRPELRRAS